MRQFHQNTFLNIVEPFLGFEHPKELIVTRHWIESRIEEMQVSLIQGGMSIHVQLSLTVIWMPKKQRNNTRTTFKLSKKFSYLQFS